MENPNRDSNENRIRREVRHHYAEVASTETGPDRGEDACENAHCGCCRDCGEPPDPSVGYTAADLRSPAGEANLGLGCGNPLLAAALGAGETVLDLGSGAGFDAFLAAERVGEKGKVIGVDMTPEMVDRARRIAGRRRIPNAEFRLGEIEMLPVASDSVDVVISNCVVNLSPDKAQVFREAFRVLRPGGRLAIADIVALAPLPEALRRDLTRYVECVGGAIEWRELRFLLDAAGFCKIRIEYSSGSALSLEPSDGESRLPIASAVICALKPLKSVESLDS